MDSKTVFLTANTNTVYNLMWLDTRKGPLVVELPTSVLAHVDSVWQRWVVDMGITGPDKGAGGKYLVLPPGHEGEVPAGYFVVRPNTYGNFLACKAFLVDGSTKPGVESVKRQLKVYPLAHAADPPEIKFANASGVPANFVMPTDYSFWNLQRLVLSTTGCRRSLAKAGS
jgi:hypothetical protein